MGRPSAGRSRLDSFRAGFTQSDALEGNSDKARMEIEGMHKRRASMGSGGSNAQWAWPKTRNPFDQFREKLWGFQEGTGRGGTGENRTAALIDDKLLAQVRDWARLLYMTHPLVPSLIDIYARFPLLDIEFRHKDDKLAEYYEDLFMNQLDYEEFLFDLSREHWVVGEAFALGSWHDGIGAWDGDELINPMDVVVTKNRALRAHDFHIKVPEEIRKLIETQNPRAEYQTLLALYPDVVNWAREDAEIPVSDVLMKQIKFKADPWGEHGIPILLRGLQVLMLEQSLNAAQDAVADRLYSPLLLANLGLDNVDEEGPWLPDQSELDALREDLHLALMSDFRLMVYHHGLSMENVWGREAMPNMTPDFDRVDMKLMQIFGIGGEMITGGKSGVPYASGALNRELITQMLTTHQVFIRKFMQSRMEVVAERQGHFEYETVGGRRIPVMETALMIDEETGEEYVEERPKLAVPEVHFRAMNLRDEGTERMFLQELKAMGFPLSNQALAMNIPFEFEEELERAEQEKIDKVMAELRYREEMFKRIYLQGLSVPTGLASEYEGWLAKQQGLVPAVPTPSALPDSDIEGPVPAPNVSPDQEQLALQQWIETESLGSEAADDYFGDAGVPQRPAESDSMRGASSGPRWKRTATSDAVPTADGAPRVEYGRMRFASPAHARVRKRMSLPRVASADGEPLHTIFVGDHNADVPRDRPRLELIQGGVEEDDDDLQPGSADGMDDSGALRDDE
jgi:hypothetical protein